MSEKEISDKMQEIMNRIKNRREELNMSYQTLSDKVGISKSTLQRYETGFIKNMPVDKLEDIAKALNVSPAYLMGWDNSENLCEMTIFEDEIEDYLQEIGEFLYYNTSHKVLFDSIMEVNTRDVEFAKQMLDRINGKYSEKVTYIKDARAEYMTVNAAHELPNASAEDKEHDEDIMDDDNF